MLSLNSLNWVIKIVVITVKGFKPVNSCVTYHDATTAQARHLRDRMIKLIYQIPGIHWVSAPFRENSIVFLEPKGNKMGQNRTPSYNNELHKTTVITKLLLKRINSRKSLLFSGFSTSFPMLILFSVSSRELLIQLNVEDKMSQENY